jgi:hypothetical protein
MPQRTAAKPRDAVIVNAAQNPLFVHPRLALFRKNINSQLRPRKQPHHDQKSTSKHQTQTTSILDDNTERR